MTLAGNQLHFKLSSKRSCTYTSSYYLHSQLLLTLTVTTTYTHSYYYLHSQLLLLTLTVTTYTHSYYYLHLHTVTTTYTHSYYYLQLLLTVTTYTYYLHMLTGTYKEIAIVGDTVGCYEHQRSNSK
ncbi:hypothetical protein EB796_001048 [Bugula neritina]|uniref:Uncharacterized protein n=1 Tax=Bugula neritina TaxID=10212 RepID=A0A7J7KRB5_BUGNE|nr:hypothetical protein EB796_001048 [Bugula neritina]